MTRLVLALGTMLALASGALAQADGDVIGPGAGHTPTRRERLEACERARQEIRDPQTRAARQAQLRQYLASQCQ